jgi:hypothetical protein
MIQVTIARNAAKTAWLVIGCPTPNDARTNILTFSATRKEAREWAAAHGYGFSA